MCGQSRAMILPIPRDARLDLFLRLQTLGRHVGLVMPKVAVSMERTIALTKKEVSVNTAFAVAHGLEVRD